MQHVTPYEGTHEYIFVSYGHPDAEAVENYIAVLQHRLCYVWFDVGVEAGADWNKVISRRLKNCSAVLLFLSKSAMDSDNVKNEIIAAKNAGKQLVIISIDGEPYDFEWQCLLGSYSFKTLKDPDAATSKEERAEFLEYNRRTIVDAIPKKFFRTVTEPFYTCGNNKFYISEAERDAASYSMQCISFSVDNGSERKILSGLVQGGPIDIRLIKQTDEDGKDVPAVEIYRVESDFKKPNSVVPVVFSIVASDRFGYPLSGPDDLRFVLNFAIINPASDNPKIVLLSDGNEHSFHTAATCMDGESPSCENCACKNSCDRGTIEKYSHHFKYEIRYKQI
ncbi:MAG: toll/interleukin-1 receptor domain-containing protein [Clostridia bacterium]|nr:toll/interleukin-1 receptor domain-containing protein [Clostridia bacterium]